MCGRYELKLTDSKKSQQIKTRAIKLNLTYQEGEIFPSNNVLCLIPFKEKIELSSKKWGIKNKTLLINARIESINEKPSYQTMLKRRCAIIATGFYEWQGKEKYYINTDEEFIYLAALFNENDELVILTAEAEDDKYKLIHHRIPIIMNQKEMLNYLYNKKQSIKDKSLHIKHMQ